MRYASFGGSKLVQRLLSVRPFARGWAVERPKYVRFIAAKKRSQATPTLLENFAGVLSWRKRNGSNIYLGKDDSVPPGGNIRATFIHSHGHRRARQTRRGRDGGNSTKPGVLQHRTPLATHPPLLILRGSHPTTALAESRRRFSKDRAAAGRHYVVG